MGVWSEAEAGRVSKNERQHKIKTFKTVNVIIYVQRICETTITKPTITISEWLGIW